MSWRASLALLATPWGFVPWFAAFGIAEVDELDWWESRRFGGLTLTAVPAQH